MVGVGTPQWTLGALTVSAGSDHKIQIQCREDIQQGRDPLSCCFFSEKTEWTENYSITATIKGCSFNNIHTFCWCFASKAVDLIYVWFAFMFPFNQIYKPHFPKPQILIPAWNACGVIWCKELIFVFFPFCIFIIPPQSVLWNEAEWWREREWNKAFGRWVILKLDSPIRVQHGGWEWHTDSILESAVAMKITFQGPWLTWSLALKASHL